MTLLQKGMSVDQIAKLIPDTNHKNYILSSLYFNNKQYKEAIVYFIKSSKNGVFAPDLAFSIIEYSCEDESIDPQVYDILYMFEGLELSQEHYDKLQHVLKKIIGIKHKKGHEHCDVKLIKMFPDFCDPFTVCKVGLRFADAQLILDQAVPKIFSFKVSLEDFIIMSCGWAIHKLDKQEEILEKLKESEINTNTTRLSKVVDVKIARDQNVNILYCCNNSFVEGMLTSINSLVKNNKESLCHYTFYICVDNSISDLKADKIKSVLNDFSLTHEIINIESYMQDHKFKSSYGEFSDFKLHKSAYYRIFALELLSHRSNNPTIYIDSDILVLEDLYHITKIDSKYLLYAVDENKELKLVKDSMSKNSLTNYFNSGFMYVKTNTKEVLPYINNAISNIKYEDRLFMHDQCALNIGFNNKYLSLDKKYNVQTQYVEKTNDLDACKILHFVGRIKPWDNVRYGNTLLLNLWEQYKINLPKTNNRGLNTDLCEGISGHRSGWKYVVDGITSHHSDNGILLDDYVERTHSWNLALNLLSKKIPHNRPWVGFMHNPPNSPHWFGQTQSMNFVLQSDAFQESLQHCKALFTLSDYHANKLRDLVNVPVYSLLHPSGNCDLHFNFKAFRRRRKIVQLGYWLRKMRNIYDIKTTYDKIWLIGQEYAHLMFNEEKIYSPHRHNFDDVSIVRNLDNKQYDNFLSDSIIVLNLYDSSANNAVIESIQRNIPIIVNKLPAVVEYLGENYPCYYNNLDEMHTKIHDDDLILEAHEYLKNMNKDFLKDKYFVQNLLSTLQEIGCY